MLSKSNQLCHGQELHSLAQKDLNLTFSKHVPASGLWEPKVIPVSLCFLIFEMALVTIQSL